MFNLKKLNSNIVIIIVIIIFMILYFKPYESYKKTRKLSFVDKINMVLKDDLKPTTGFSLKMFGLKNSNELLRERIIKASKDGYLKYIKKNTNLNVPQLVAVMRDDKFKKY